MSLRADLRSALSNWGSFSGVGHDLHLTGGDYELQAAVLSADQLAVAVDYFQVRRPLLSRLSWEQLQQTAGALSRKLTYLLEPILTIECDPDQAVVQLRSQPPTREEQSLHYYELLVRSGGTFELVRYRKEPGGVRMRIPIMVTIEVLLRLAEDFVAV